MGARRRMEGAGHNIRRGADCVLPPRGAAGCDLTKVRGRARTLAHQWKGGRHWSIGEVMARGCSGMGLEEGNRLKIAVRIGQVAPHFPL